MGIALNMDGGSHGQITFYKNNVALVSNYDLTANFDYVMPFASVDACTSEYNFGSPIYANSSDAADANGYGAFEYAPPSGYFALCTKNLAEYG